ncbi:hypothetical protein C0966_07335 [Bacillus methanolicus]|uniref:DUF4352 domain-containing protein n=1 Tax=Bacillus methanolicus TaxID=1471 RepID=UPI00238062E9|nr:DUF4352 domain-containing protein [Bacillus methanolicus]MDE3839172.1 hypothetical protein [Bacillus methanolicus]
MKKIFVTALIVGFLLTGCNESSTTAVKDSNQNQQTDEPKETNVKFGKEFKVEFRNWNGEIEQEIKLKVDNVKIESNISPDQITNEQNDFVGLDLSVENIGKTETNEFTVTASSFSVFNDKGMEISSFPVIGGDKVTYKPTNLRPNGKNEGRIYLTIPKGEKVSEIIYYNNLIKDNGDKFIFKVKN